MRMYWTYAIGRSFIAQLTAAGIKLVEKAIPLHYEFLEAGLKDISLHDRATLVNLLVRISAGFAQLAGVDGNSESSAPVTGKLARVPSRNQSMQR